MNKIHLTVIFFFFNLLLYSQQNAVVHYKVTLYDGKFQNNKEANDFVVTLLSKSKDFLKQTDFVLKINNNEGIFIVDKTLSVSDESVSKFAYAIIEADGLTYLNSNTREVLHQMEAYGSQIILLSSLNDQNWKIENQTKVINGFTCYKAQLTIGNSSVTAWYAPKIALVFGPAGYGGLPGLILQLEVQNTFNPHTYYVTKIELNTSEKLSINKPEKGKLVNKAEFDQMGEKAKENLKKMGN